MKQIRFAKLTPYLFTLRRYLPISIFWGILLGVIVSTNAIGTTKAEINLSQFTGSLVNTPGLVALFGQFHAINTVEGYAVWKTFIFVTIIMATWGIVTASALFRGNEEEGRMELFASGQATMRSITSSMLIGIFTCITVIFLISSLVIITLCNTNGVHFTAGGSLLLAFVYISTALMFVSITALLGQLFVTKGQVLLYSIIIYGIMYIGRMVADTMTSLAWLNNINPLGWIENIQPFTANNVGWIFPVLCLTLVCSLVAIYFSGKRDISSALIVDDSKPCSNLFLLQNQFTFFIRENIYGVLGWSALAIFAFVCGSLVNAGGQALASSHGLSTYVNHIATETNNQSALVFLGFLYLFVMVIISFIAISKIGKIRNDEASGYLDNLLVRRASRTTLLIFYLIMCVAEIIYISMLMSLFMWIGSLVVHNPVDLDKLVLAGFNAITPAVFILGIGFLVYGIAPRLAVIATYIVFVWSIFIDIIGLAINLNSFIMNTSLFYHISLAPSVNPDWTAVFVISGLGIIASLTGIFVFNIRDIQSD